VIFSFYVEKTNFYFGLQPLAFGIALKAL